MTSGVERIVVRDDQPERDLTFRAVVLVVVLMLLISWILLYVAIGPHTTPPGGDDDGEGELWWMVPAETQNITEDTVWSGEDRTLAQPVVVRTGASLSIVDVNIRIPLEDMVFWRRPAFDVEEGASLHLDHARVEVYQDPQLASSVIGVIDPGHDQYPHVARPVNLVGARTPVLRFVLYHPRDTTDVSVVVLPEGGDELVVLESFRAGDLHPRTPIDVVVPLHQYNGTVPWLVILLGSYPTDLTFISELRVEDGDGPPPGDMFPTGNAYEDGWRVQGFLPIQAYQNNVMWRADQTRQEGEGWRGLIEAMGDVTLTDSELVEPEGMGREVYLDYVKEAIDPEEHLPVHLSGSHGGHVGIECGTVSIEGSVLENVPLTAVNATLDIARTDFSGDTDLVSLSSPSGTIERCDFRYHPEGWIEGGPRERYLWALAVEGSSPDGPLAIERCTFRDVEQALDLSHADVRVNSLSLEGVSQLGVWDHASRGLEDLEAFLSGSVYSRVYENLLIRTNVTEVEFFDSDRPGEVVEVHRGNPLRFDLDIGWPVQGSLSFARGDRARYIIPELLVKSGGRTSTENGVRASVIWKGIVYYFPIPDGTPTMRVDLADLEAQANASVTKPIIEMYRVNKDRTMDPDTFGFTVRAHPRDLLVERGAVLTWDLDGALMEEMGVDEGTTPAGSSSVLFHQDLTLALRDHVLVVSLLDREGGSMAEPLRIDLLVPDPSMENDPAEVARADYLLLYPGQDLVFPPFGMDAVEEGNVVVDVVGPLGSTARFDLSGLPEEAGFGLAVLGNTSVEVANGSLEYVSVITEGYSVYANDGGETVTLRNITSVTTVAAAGGHNLLMQDVITLRNTYIEVQDCPEALVYNCTFLDHVGWINSGDSNVVLIGCTFTSEWPDGLVVRCSNMTNLTVIDCNFVKAYMAFLLPGQSSFWETRYLNITGCTFMGRDAILYVGSDIVDVSSYDDDPDWVPPLEGTIEGNLFEGGANDVVLHHGLYASLWGENELYAFPSLFAMYITRLQVIPPDTTPSHGNYVFVRQKDVVTEWPYDIDRWITMDGEVLYNVTADISRESDPPLLPVLLRSTDYNNRIVRGFATVDPDADNDEATYPDLPDFRALLEAVVGSWEP